MTKSKSTKKALVSSVVSMFLSCTMLFGTTFAWFTDSAVNSSNRIIAGNLEIDLLMDKEENGKYVSIAGSDGDIFAEANGGDGVNWEPGKTEIVYLAVKNKGSLALKYNMSLKIIDGGLADALEYAILDNTKARDVTIDNWETIAASPDVRTGKVTAGIITVADNGELIKTEDADYFAIAVHMPDNAKNEFQGDTITIDLTLVAAQTSYEEDSFGSDYDIDAVLEAADDAFTVTKANISDIDFDKDNVVYKFSGDFDTLTIEAKPGLNQIFDGTEVTGDAKIIIMAPGILSSYESLRGEKEGSYTVTGFNAKQIDVFAYDTTVNIVRNKVEFVHIGGANLDINISRNEIDAKFKVHNISENATQSDYGVYLYVTDYDLEFTNNTVTNTLSHAIGINGRQSEAGGFATAGENDVISVFTGNEITVNSTEETERAALKIWDSAKYAPSGSTELNENAKELVEAIKTDNTYDIGETHVYFDFNGVKVSEI